LKDTKDIKVAKGKKGSGKVRYRKIV
jgi:hypothetical protein